MEEILAATRMNLTRDGERSQAQEYDLPQSTQTQHVAETVPPIGRYESSYHVAEL
jgi:hypothetical protein